MYRSSVISSTPPTTLAAHQATDDLSDGHLPFGFGLDHGDGEQLALQSLVAIQLEHDQGAHLVAVHAAILGCEILGDVFHEGAAFAALDFRFHFTNGVDHALFHGQRLAAGRDQG